MISDLTLRSDLDVLKSDLLHTDTTRFLILIPDLTPVDI